MDDQTTIVVKALNLTWDEFCKQHAGASRAHADEIIRRLEEFGAAYFRISEIIRSSPQSYRAILRGRPSQSVVCQSPQTALPGRRRRRKTIACAARG